MLKRSAKFTRSSKKRFPGFKLPFKILITIFLLLLLGGGGWWVFKTFKTPVVIKLDNVSCADDLRVNRLLEEENIKFYWLKSQDIEKKLKQNFSCISLVTVVRKFPMTVSVSLSGREPMAVFRVIQKFTPTPPPMDDLEASASSQEAKPSLPPQVSVSYGETVLVDGKGVAFEKGSRDDLPFINIVTTKFDIGDTIGERNMRLVMEIWQFFSSQGMPLTSAELETDKLTVKPQEEIIFSLTESLDRQRASLQLIWKQAKINSKSVVKIDLRFDKPVVIYMPEKK